MPLQVEQQNGAILAEGGRKLEVLKAIKDFKKGIYGLQWEHKRSKLEVRPWGSQGCCVSHNGSAIAPSLTPSSGSERREATLNWQALCLVSQCAMLAVVCGIAAVQQQPHEKSNLSLVRKLHGTQANSNVPLQLNRACFYQRGFTCVLFSTDTCKWQVANTTYLH